MRGADFLEYNYNALLQRALAEVPDDMDKREGSVIYDALAPCCMVLAQMYYNLYEYYKNTYALWAEGEYLDYRVAERGLSRYEATYAVKLGEFRDDNGALMDVPLGSRFCTIDDRNPIYYTVTAPYIIDGAVQKGFYELTCDTLGTVGNIYTGELVNIQYVYGIATATMTNMLPLKPARDKETDEELRQRYFDNLKAQAFGGNIPDYKELVLGLDGIGAVQIYPVWNGGGTVKLSIISPDYELLSAEFLAACKEAIDPLDYTTEGIGLAPIGHNVTVVTADDFVVDVSTEVELKTGYGVEDVRASISQALNEYLLSVRKEWGKMQTDYTYKLKLYISQINNAILGVPGVINVTNTKINGSGLDVTLQENSSTQELPFLGTVTINDEE